MTGIDTTINGMENLPNGSASPLTISQWKSAQIRGDGLDRLLSLVSSERAANPTTKAWISLASPEQIKAQWTTLQTLTSDTTSLPLYGVPFAAKDNIDAEGFVTTAACPTFTSTPATSDATVIAKLKAAGAILIGKTNLDQFATGLVGTRSPYGAVPNSFDPSRVSGGSSSGSAVVVSRGIVPFSLGTDTAGSGRVPAGFNNIVGLKPTRGALSTHGVLPACKSLDCVSIFTLTVGDAETILSVAEGYDVQDPYSRSRPDPDIAPYDEFGGSASLTKPSLAICASPDWFGRHDHYPAYEKALAKAEALGWTLVPVDFSLLFRLARLLYNGPWVAERYEAIRGFIESAAAEEMDPVVRKIIIRAQTLSAADVFEGEYLRQELTRQIEREFARFDGLLVPTSPTFPTLDELVKNPVEENSILGTYTNFVNFLDWSALSIPVGFRQDSLPFGVTLISTRWQEPFLLSWAREWFGSEERLLGATGVSARESPTSISSIPSNYIPIAVVGAHLTGFPLNKDVATRGGRFLRATKTSSSYRLYSLNTTVGPKKPGLRRVSADEGAEIEVEVWNLPKTSLASFMLTIPPPLAIGSIELKDGSWVKGFVCEPCGFDEAVDITSHGGWRAYHASLKKEIKSLTNGVSKRAISTILIANRGEIAVRIIETIHKMGLRAVAIYSEIDADAAHVSKADIALKLEGSSVSETYLDMDQILKLASQSSTDAIIPGYGFLSENAEFATAVEEKGMIWIGPAPKQMADLGLKHRARAIAVEAGVPVVPGCDALLTSLEEALKESERIGFPLMLKSTAGGGGIGLSYCKDRQSLATTFESVQRQAEANFGNGGVFIERFIQRARHVEVQILGDGKGRVIAAGERDCSLQRRHQKVVEESPAILVPESIRAEMRAAAIRLASSVEYRNVGTVEFIYDIDSREFYFLEVNTRLQVEHPVTESVTGLDLVECMINIADGNATRLFGTELKVCGASIEVRVYAESPLQSFRPCAGRITALEFPSSLRVDTWIQLGTEITTSFDPLVAKLIASGSNREEAIENLAEGLAATRIEGVQTNLEYLRQIVASPMFRSGDYTTKSLDSFQFRSSSFEVLQPGALTTIQDYPGRTGYWNIGIPPGGPMDSYSFRLANRLVDNPLDAAGLECTLGGPSLKFHFDAVIAAVGGVAQVTIDDMTVSMNQAIGIKSGQILNIGVVEHGHRVYLAIRGGIEVPVVMGSRATFELGKLGGFGGRKLQAHDILAIGPANPLVSEAQAISPVPVPTHPKASWTIRVIPGPHGAPDYFTPESVKTLYLSDWKVHHNSNRLGVRLTGPQPEWSRRSGGEAGLHPSNIHDAPYSIGSVSFTGDEAVVLGCDGPSLGGFVVLCVVCSADLWKMGQVRPGDTIRFDPIDVATAIGLERKLDEAIETLSPLETLDCIPSDEVSLAQKLESIPAAVGIIEHEGQRITIRQAGDRAFLLEFGDTSAFNLLHNFEISAFCENHEKSPISGVEELTPGVFSLHVTYTRGLSQELMLARLADHIRSYKVPSQVPSRSVRLPIAFDDSVSRAAIERYTATIRPNAPWLPSNIDFLQKLNGISDLTKVLSAAEFVVLGLGDVFMGSPCAIPLDPRHRLFGTKYNPSRSFTPRGAVGIGGQYMCIYATDSPGGYQLVGRTVEIWDADLVDTEAWFFRRFDRISFYPVTEAALDGTPRSELVQISDGVLDLEQYETWLTTNKEDIATAADQQARAISTAPFVDELLLPYQVESVVNGHSPSLDSSGLHGERVRATMPGRCYKVMVKEGSAVDKGDVLVCIESSKMEVEIRSPAGGKCLAVLVQAGDLIDVEDDLVVIDLGNSV
ncbi:DUR1 2-urea amidolyase [Fusarium tjaetaba]|uniref:DUR1 2-urea amidolyase n=1 Tax=Fusarium tjaetaba TaxID=1567544 RepID=A0A8H5S8T7_9HYPO|nr:DUR1 2-urea amidolyase [Fusarium tjaetaba]KAF5646658.1 DUR1 2-urea amidolyase [Fusarium tjaetaba]